MPRIGVLAAVLGGALALIALTLALLPEGDSGATTAPASETTDAGTVTITVDSSSGTVAWGRLRWLLAGLSISAVALVTARQVTIAASPKRPASTIRRPAPRPEPARPAVFDPAGASWIPDAAQVSIGD